MSHRYRSHCCCGVTGEEVDGRPFDCFYGWGAPPPTPFIPVQSKNRGGSGLAYASDFYSNSQGKNPWDNWSSCSHSLDRELIVSLERNATMDDRSEGAYGPPGDVPPECTEIDRTGVPSTGVYSIPGLPMYARYRRLYGSYDNGEIFDPDFRRNWARHPQKPTERNYMWNFEQVPNQAFRGLNSGSARYPLLVNSRTDEPRDPFFPHGTENYEYCGSAKSAYCDDCVCTYVGNECAYGFQSPYFCNLDYRGAYHKPLTPAQAHLIGKGWKTSENGFIPTWKHTLYGASSWKDNGCGNDVFDYFDNRVYEMGGLWFHLQGISDHTSNYKTDDEKIRMYRHFAPSSIAGYDFIRLDRSSYCDSVAVLWPLNETHIGNMRREAWWELYWSGFTKKGFDYLGINHPNPGDEYFVSDASANAGQQRLPSYIGFGCSAIPLFSWEIAYLYFNPDSADSIHASLVDPDGNPYYRNNEEAGYANRELFIGEGIYDYQFTNDTINFYTTAFEGSEEGTFIMTQIALLNNGNLNDRCKAHRLMIGLCLYSDAVPLPTEVTDALEDYGILPPAINHGEEHDYKIYKKKIVYNTEDDTPTTGEKVACCVSLGDQFPAANCKIPICDKENPSVQEIIDCAWNYEECQSQSIENSTRACLLGPTSEYIWNLRRENGETNEFGDPLPVIPDGGFVVANDICNIFPDFCGPTGCLGASCENFVCQSDSFCCTDLWDINCSNAAVDGTLCGFDTTCINATPFDCTNVLGGIIIDGTTCPSDSGSPFDQENCNFCRQYDRGSCCIFSREIVTGQLVTYYGCTDVEENKETGQEGKSVCFDIAEDNTNANYSEYVRWGNCNVFGPACEAAALTADVDNDGNDDSDQINPCVFNDATVEDFYFYGAPGGWTWYQRGRVNDLFGINDTTIRGGGWAPVPTPLKSTFYLHNPAGNQGTDFYSECCTPYGGSDGNWCDGGILFTTCQNAWPPNIFGQGEDPFEDQWGKIDTGEDGYGEIDFDGGISTTCSNAAATITCRGIWFQWQKYDYALNNPDDPAGGAFFGCDTITNSFFLVQDPYKPGIRYEIGITLDENGITTGMVDGIIGKEIDILRGHLNSFDVRGGLNPDIEEEFKGPDYEVQDVCVYDDGQTEGVTLTMRSSGFQFAVRGDHPDNSPPDDPIQTEYFYTSSVRFNKLTSPFVPESDPDKYVWTFNPFEQLDNLPETKSDDEAWWQIYEVFQGIYNCGGGDQIIRIEYKPIQGSPYGKINISDDPDTEYEEICPETNRQRYTGTGARITEYQWYHPPYVKVTGQPGFAFYSANTGKPCSDYVSYYTLPWGGCCNSVPSYNNSTRQKGYVVGPSPMETEDQDKYLPAPPEEIER